jgi:hypothetical protein
VAEDVLTLERRSLAFLFRLARLLSTVRLAFGPGKLLVAGAGFVLAQGGLSWLAWMLPASGSASPELSHFTAPLGVERAGPEFAWQEIAGLPERLVEPVRLLAAPLLAGLEPGCSWGQMIHALLAVAWIIVVWGVCGGTIARMTVLEVNGMRPAGLAQAGRFVSRSASALVAAPLGVLLALGSCALFGAAFGGLYRIPAVGPFLAGLLLVIPLGAGLVMALLLAGFVVGWPLLHAALASGAEDALDALSRTFGYLNQRLGAFSMLVMLAGLLGMTGMLFMDLMGAAVVRLTHWSLGLTVPEARLTAHFGGAGVSTDFLTSVCHSFWLGVVRLIVHGWIYSFYWTAASVVYLWLRQDVDGTPWSEIGPRDETNIAIEGGGSDARSRSEDREPESPGLP